MAQEISPVGINADTEGSSEGIYRMVVCPNAGTWLACIVVLSPRDGV